MEYLLLKGTEGRESITVRTSIISVKVVCISMLNSMLEGLKHKIYISARQTGSLGAVSVFCYIILCVRGNYFIIFQLPETGS